MENTFTTTQPDDQPPRILALDFGARNIGLAVSDELGVTAQGLPTLRRSTKRNDFDHVRRMIKQFHVTEIVVGLPLRMSGSEGIQSDKVQVFAEELRRRFKLPVHLFDERLTSVEANRLLRETDMSTRQRAGAVDQLAAVLILQSFLEFRKNKPNGPQAT
jgi:putative Holliday junction resolvase